MDQPTSPSGERALELAYRHLNRRDRTEADLRAHLERSETDAAAIDFAISELVGTGVIDDARFARLFTEDKRALDGWGAERIRETLRQRGIERDTIEHALAAAEGENESELERALALLRSRFPSPPADRRERDRALGVMIRKGYDSEIALDALTVHARESAADTD